MDMSMGRIGLRYLDGRLVQREHVEGRDELVTHPLTRERSRLGELVKLALKRGELLRGGGRTLTVLGARTCNLLLEGLRLRLAVLELLRSGVPPPSVSVFGPSGRVGSSGPARGAQRAHATQCVCVTARGSPRARVEGAR